MKILQFSCLVIEPGNFKRKNPFCQIAKSKIFTVISEYSTLIYKKNQLAITPPQQIINICCLRLKKAT